MKNIIKLSTVALLVAGIVACGESDDDDASVAPEPSIVPDLITASLIADVNNDGSNDVIISSHGGGHAAPQVFLNNGDGTLFTQLSNAIPPQYKGVDGAAVDMQSVDANSDGIVDLLVSTVDVSDETFYKSGQIQLYMGLGDGTFSDATSTISANTTTELNTIISGESTVEWYERIKMHDIDRDGYMDIVATDNGSYIIYANDTIGGYHPVDFAYTDVTNLDPLGPEPTYLAPTAETRFVISGMLMGDINNDSKSDFIDPVGWGVHLNTSTPGNYSFDYFNDWGTNGLGSGLHQGELIDINSDGNLDLVASLGISSSMEEVYPVYAFEGDGLGGFVLNNNLLAQQPSLHHGRQYIVDDFNADGINDLFIVDHGWDYVPYPGAQNWMLYNNGGQLTDVSASNLSTQSGYTHQASTGDLNGDGSVDLLLNNSTSCGTSSMTCAAEPRFWLNDGSGNFSAYSPVFK